LEGGEILRKLSIILSIFLFIDGCVTSKPMVSMNPGASLKGYKTIYVLPVSNEAGGTFEFDVSGTLTQKIKAKLNDRGYILSDGTGSQTGVLIIKSSLLSYEPGSAFKRWVSPGFGKTQATVKTLLIDKSTGKVLGEMVSAEAVTGGGLYSAGADTMILDAIAEGIADEIVKKAKGQ
jgi:hypothetical protein